MFDAPGARRHAPARPGARAGRGVGAASRRSGATGRARRGARPTSASWRRAGTCTAPAIPTARRCAAPSRPAYAHTGRRSRVRGDDRAVERRAAARRRLDAGSRARREHGRARELPEDGQPRQPAGREHRPHPRDLADARRLRVVRAARRQGARRRASRSSPSSSSPTASPPTRSTSRDWNDFNQNTATDEELAAIETAVAEYFARHTMQELYDIACETNLMLAPANSPREIYASAQLAARDFFGPVGDVERFPRSFVVVRSADGEAAPVAPANRAQPIAPTAAYPRGARRAHAGQKAWDGVQILEFGSGAAGPIATRYFVEHGATVLRVESRTRPDFLRAMALAVPDNPHGLEGSPMYDGLNVGKRNLTLNLKKPEAVELVKRLVVEWADAVAENYAPSAMKGFGLDYDSARRDQARPRDDQRVPQRPDRSAQGLSRASAARAPRSRATTRSPAGPTASPSGRTARSPTRSRRATSRPRSRPGCSTGAAPATACTSTSRRSSRRSGRSRRGCSTTRSTACIRLRDGNRHRDARPARRVPVRRRGRRRRPVGRDRVLDRRRARARCATIAGDDVEAWTAHAATRAEVAETLQAAGIEAVPVQDFGDLHDDPQLAHRGHFEPHTHPFLGPGLYERNGFRLAACPGGYDQAGPTLGQDNDWVLARPARIERRRDRGIAGDAARSSELARVKVRRVDRRRSRVDRRDDHRARSRRRGSCRAGACTRTRRLLDGFVVENDGRPVGCALWHEVDGDAELVVHRHDVPRRGRRHRAARRGRRARARTTAGSGSGSSRRNDNTDAIRLYQRAGWDWVDFHRDARDATRVRSSPSSPRPATTASRSATRSSSSTRS